MVSATCTGTITDSVTIAWTSSAVTATTTVNTDSCDDLEVNVKVSCPSSMGEYSMEFDNIWDYGGTCGTSGVEQQFDITEEVEKAAGQDMSDQISNAITAGTTVCSIEIEFGDDECTYTPSAVAAYNTAGQTLSAAVENPAKTTGVLFGLAALAGLAVYAVKRRNRAKKSLINDDMLAGNDGQVV